MSEYGKGLQYAQQAIEILEKMLDDENVRQKEKVLKSSELLIT